jgi:DNA-binding transcriptional LysR family regulator
MTPLRIEVRHLAALAAVARTSSFGGAADALGYVPSAVTRQVGVLEGAVGCRLVERTGRPAALRLTDAGSALLDHAEAILGDLRSARTEIETLTAGADRAPAVGLVAHAGERVAARLLAALGPGGWSRTERAPASRLLESVESGELDGALVGLPVASGPFFAAELVREPYVLAVPGPCRDVADALARWPLVAVDGCPSGAGRVRHRAERPGAALAFVRAGVAAAVLPRADAAAGAPDARLLALDDVPPLVLGLAWRRDRDDAAAVRALRTAACRAFGTGTSTSAGTRAARTGGSPGRCPPARPR